MEQFWFLMETRNLTREQEASISCEFSVDHTKTVIAISTTQGDKTEPLREYDQISGDWFDKAPDYWA